MLRRLKRAMAAVLAGLLLLALPVRAVEILDHAAVSIRTEGDSETHSLSDIKLPYNWDSRQGAVRGQARFSLEFRSTDTVSPQAIYIRLIGNTFEVHLNGERIGKAGESGKNEDFAKKPFLFPIRPGLLRERNTLLVTIDAQEGRNAGLSTVVVGPEDKVRQGYESHYRVRVIGSMVVCIISTVLGMLSMLLWLRQREPLYAFYGLSELLWAVQVSDVLIERPPLPWPVWGMVIWSAYAVAPALICKFTMVVVELHHGFLRRLTSLQLLMSVPVVVLARLAGWLWLWAAWKAVVVLVATAVGMTVVWHGIRSASWEKRILAIAVIATVCTALRDLLVIVILPQTGILPRYANTYGETSWVRYVWIAFGMTLAWIVAERLRKSTQAVARMNRTLAARLLQREAELEAMYKRQADAERQQAMVEERQRLTRDMHDGLGSQLLGALHLAQNPEVSKDTLALQLRDALDQLKLTVDAMQDTEGDITTLLGSLRYRLGSRLQSAGVELDWEVAPLPAIPGWTLQHSRDLQMLLFEAFSNIIVHAGASRASLRAVADDRSIRITLGDNGRGFDPGVSSTGHGMRNMRSRAARLGAVLEIQASGEGAQVSLSLPVRETQA